jgi:CheY-like chemotaxis protein
VPLAHILIVDDEEDNLEVFATTLEKEGFSVDGYTNPYEALSIFRPRAYDLLIVITACHLSTG